METAKQYVGRTARLYSRGGRETLAGRSWLDLPAPRWHVRAVARVRPPGALKRPYSSRRGGDRPDAARGCLGSPSGRPVPAHRMPSDSGTRRVRNVGADQALCKCASGSLAGPIRERIHCGISVGPADCRRNASRSRAYLIRPPSAGSPPAILTPVTAVMGSVWTVPDLDDSCDCKLLTVEPGPPG